MAAKVTRLTHKMAIQLHLVAGSFTICRSCSRWAVRTLLDTPDMKAQWRGIHLSVNEYLNCFDELWHELSNRSVA